jgi:hypothetical protein
MCQGAHFLLGLILSFKEVGAAQSLFHPPLKERSVFRKAYEGTCVRCEQVLTQGRSGNCQVSFGNSLILLCRLPRPIHGPSPAPAGRSFRGGGLQGQG